MQESKFPPLGSTIECTLVIKGFVAIPIYEDLLYALLYLMIPEENEKRIRKWMEKAKIEIINYNEFEHFYSPPDEIVLDVFWYVVNKLVNIEEPLKIRYLKNILYSVLKNRNSNLDEVKSFVDIISNYSILHLRVLWSVDGLLDYIIKMRIPTINTIPETLAKCIDYAIPDLKGEYEKLKQIWNDLFETGLRKDANLHMWMTDKKFAWMSLTSDYGKKFLRLITNCG